MRHAGRLSASRQQFIAKLDQTGGSLLRDLTPITGTIDQRAAALCDRLQHVAEE